MKYIIAATLTALALWASLAVAQTQHCWTWCDGNGFCWTRCSQ